MIAIIDYGMGNLHSVQKALESFGEKTLVVNESKGLCLCDKVVLPGVGAFADAMAALKKQDLIAGLSEHIKKKKIFLGICLGMQLLFTESEEGRKEKGLGIFSGKVKRFTGQPGQKVPHIGWNELKRSPRHHTITPSDECPLLKGVPDNAFVYFCHSYYPEPANKGVIAATTDYGINFTSVVWQENIYGMQFHPEKSQTVGLKILKNFVEL